MTQLQFEQLEPRKTMLYPKSEGMSVQYMYMGINKDGSYQLCGMPFGYSLGIIKECFEIAK